MKPRRMGKSRSPRPLNRCVWGWGEVLPWDQVGLDPQGRISPVGPMQSGLRDQPRGKRARGVGEEVNPPRGLPRSQGPLSVTLPVPGALKAPWVRTAATGLPETHCDHPRLCRASRQPGPGGKRRGNVPLRPTHSGRAEMPEPARAPVILTPVGLLIRLKTRGTGFSERERSARQQGEAPAAVCFTVWSGLTR